jgi:hypothetical protein
MNSEPGSSPEFGGAALSFDEATRLENADMRGLPENRRCLIDGPVFVDQKVSAIRTGFHILTERASRCCAICLVNDNAVHLMHGAALDKRPDGAFDARINNGA